MNEQPAYNSRPGKRWGNGSASVLRYLLKDLAQKPAPLPAATRREPVRG